MNGPYSQGYDYDKWGNLTHRFGWGGDVQGGVAGQSSDLYYTYTNGKNQRDGFTYDAAGNLTNDTAQAFTYDAVGQQASSTLTNLQQAYDGDGLRVRKSDSTTGVTYYLRSSVLGGQVVGQLVNIGGVWQWNQGYVYLGSQLLATQHYGVNFVHEDPVTKSKRVTDMSGNVLSTVETDPWGADTSRSGNAAFQPRKFTSYERDANGSDDAMFRRYNKRHGRFDQPDPYDGSYNLSNPQSFNRYAYVGNDPVNFVDPSGLDLDPITITVIGNIDSAVRGGTGGSLAGLVGGRDGSILDEVTLEVGIGGDVTGTGPQGPVVADSSNAPPNVLGCDLKLAKLFGGLGAVVGSTSDPGTLEFYKRRGRSPSDYLPRAAGHGPAPFDNPDPKSKDRGGIIHIYGNPEGTAMNVGLYAPSGGRIGPIFTTGSGNVQRNVTYSGGITIAFVHVIPFAGSDRNSMGSVRIGNIGGPDSSDDLGYRHSHLAFFKNGARTDPSSIYCKEFGY